MRGHEAAHTCQKGAPRLPRVRFFASEGCVWHGRQHPDKNKGNPAWDMAMWHDVQLSYAVLSNPAFRREVYDKCGAAGVFALLAAGERGAAWPGAGNFRAAGTRPVVADNAKVLVALRDGRVVAVDRMFCKAEEDPFGLASPTHAATTRCPPPDWSSIAQNPKESGPTSSSSDTTRPSPAPLQLGLRRSLVRQAGPNARR